MATNGFDYDVIVIGSGFGGSVAAMRATEKGYRVGVMEAGKRWNDEDIPHTSWDVRRFAWQPELDMYGIQRVEFLDDVLVLSGAGVGGGLAERAMSFWPNRGDADPRPALGSGYNRLKPVMPHKPMVPSGAPAELRLDAKKEDVIPLYPY